MNLLEPRTGPSDELDEIRALARPLHEPMDLDPLLERIGDARYVLLGEASHGTSDYYRWRAEITRRLITERGFSFVAVEGDWPDCFAINRWAKGRVEQDRSAREVLGRFERWPTWMWANEEVAGFVDWLRDHNVRTGADVGFYGLDVYSLWESLQVLFGYVVEHRPEALDALHSAWQCFEPYREDPQRYAWATRMVPASCESEVVELLVDLHRAPALLADDDPEAELDALQNAEVLAGAERYYRAMVQADGDSWNVRDCHMADTLDRLVAHHDPDAKVVVWEHNTHVGDARATDMATAGMVNVGQLVRERHDAEGVVLVGFGGHHGEVIAGSSWGAPMQRLPVGSPPPGTHEDLLHQALGSDSLMVFPDRRDTPWLAAARGHRAIGVVYRPEGDARGNWVTTVMGRRYDAFCSFDRTDALHPLHHEEAAAGGEQETYPWTT
ncbi:erythromycin esterase family protein [Iamia sp.]|uniref:erythromycin esterase family protein n=1 Tax=Iamia sp. TaxID=2722710 RepID=UPI002CF1335A|nr:erythromycin esterase family protein [Iamia sp.]HXH56536.1 erythromycin esterase family protein [Iamia sp.]